MRRGTGRYARGYGMTQSRAVRHGISRPMLESTGDPAPTRRAASLASSRGGFLARDAASHSSGSGPLVHLATDRRHPWLAFRGTLLAEMMSSATSTSLRLASMLLWRSAWMASSSVKPSWAITSPMATPILRLTRRADCRSSTGLWSAALSIFNAACAALRCDNSAASTGCPVGGVLSRLFITRRFVGLPTHGRVLYSDPSPDRRQHVGHPPCVEAARTSRLSQISGQKVTIGSRAALPMVTIRGAYPVTSRAGGALNGRVRLGEDPLIARDFDKYRSPTGNRPPSRPRCETDITDTGRVEARPRQY